MKPIVKVALVVIIAVMVVTPAVLFYGMKISPISWQLLGPVNHEAGLMLKGYDIVAYYNDGMAIKGDSNKGLKWNDNIWYFSSDANKLTFKTFPDKFVPEYGSYCATAVSKGLTADINPEIWHIEDGRLFLFFDETARADFIENIDNGIINKADTEWHNQ